MRVNGLELFVRTAGPEGGLPVVLPTVLAPGTLRDRPEVAERVRRMI